MRGDVSFKEAWYVVCSCGRGYVLLLGRDMSSGSRCDLGARGLSLQEVRTCGRGMLL